ncbi:sterol desaturase family protein [Sphingomonas sp. AR_OL41]|uniref:sterol desaturase family protein n=1 Tax=Sphingomonas sp. AR_OL41 TaxID=3042729 RepID=UPI002480FEEB|nr:sterol desaturase family protein [Sphingomonas sp. AR_OL41]MDH7975464.1 sterol desaturase family protein [Sphingomonas sp. AR_OL41]
MFDTLSRFALHWVHSFQIEMIRYLIAAAGVALSYWALRRWTAPRRIQRRLASFADRRREFLLSVQTIAVFGVVDLIAFAAIGAGIIAIHRGPPNWAIFAAQLVVMIGAHDTWFYWMHRGLHLRALFLKAHAAHHKSRTPTSWASYAFAPIESVFESLYVPVLLFGISLVTPVYPLAIFVFLGHQIARNAIGHSGHELAWPGFTRSRWTGWLTTTTHHDLHHSEGRYDFGLYFTWWDRIMGTQHPRYHERFEAVARPWIGGAAQPQVATEGA